MTSHRTLFSQPDERQALEQLERLHREIQNARRQRERAGAEFDGFVAGFQDSRGEIASGPRPVPPSRRPRPAALRRVVTPAPRPEAAPAEPEPPPSHVAVVQAPSPPPPPLTASSTPAPPQTDAEPVTPRTSSRRATAIAAILTIVALAGGTYLWRNSASESAGPKRDATRTAAPAVVLPHEEIASRPPLAPVATAPPVLQVEIATIRAVWLRATVDGHRAVERQVPAGTRLTFTPSDSITVRAGDAGAVRVKIGAGPEEPMGRDGQVLTRVFVVGSDETK